MPLLSLISIFLINRYFLKLFIQTQMLNIMDNKPEEKTRKEIGNYILGKTLGQGTFGKVKLAIHKPTNEQVAIKILEKQKIIDVADVERVSREIHILKLIRHPNIIQLYQIIQTPKYLFLVMEFVQNGQLFEYIVKNKRLKEQQACKLFHQLINGIQYIHKLNIVHRDLKPENLLLDYDKSLKLVDFGLSNTYNNNQTLKTPCGSPCYAAPQMIKGQKYEGLKVDIWSSGVILFAMVCGCLPFEDPNTANLYKKILSGKYTVSKNLSNEGRDILSKILQVDPQKRYTIQQIRQHKWMSLNTDIPNNQGIIVGYNRIPMQSKIVNELNTLNYQFEYVKKCIQANRHNDITTTYYLLFKKYLKNGGKSSCDMASKQFDKCLIEPMKRNQKSKSRLIMEDLLQLNKQNQKSRSGSCAKSLVHKNINEFKDHLKNLENKTNKGTSLVQPKKKQNKQNLKINNEITRGRSKQLVTPANRINKRYREQFNKSLISKSNEKTFLKSQSKNEKTRPRIVSNSSVKNGHEIISIINSTIKDQNKSQFAEISNLIDEYNLSKTLKNHKRGRSNNVSLNKKSKNNQSLNGTSRHTQSFFKKSRI